MLRALVTALSFKATVDPSGSWSFGLDLSNVTGGGADTGKLETDLTKLVRDLSLAAQEKEVGLAILIDEAQELTDEELTAVCATAHQVSQNNWPCLFALAGLPSIPRMLAEAKSYSERLFNYWPIEKLNYIVARDAIIEPARGEGVAWEDWAVDHIVAESRGYPYFLQQYGQETWDIAEDETFIAALDARIGVVSGRATLDGGFFRVRWDRATKSEKGFLRALAEMGYEANTGDLARNMGKTHRQIGPARAALISKGLIYASEHGVVAFTVPGMAEFIHRQPDD